MEWQLWIGPAIVAAVISSLISVLGWVVTYDLDHRKDRHRRREKVRDFCIALRAEIRSELKNLTDTNFDEHLATIEQAYRDKSYSVSVPTSAPHVVFDTVVKEIHVLPGTVIDPVVIYTRQRHAIEAMIADMRADSFAKLAQPRQLKIYADYIALKRHARDLAKDAVDALDAAI